MMLFMTDQQVKHDGKMWGIEEMTEKGGQTIVHLKHGDDRQTYTNILDTKDIIITDVPIEELEAVEE